MGDINWKHKLASRKFWLAVVGFISASMYAFNIAEVDVEKVVSVVMAGATLISYILAEGWIDGNREKYHIEECEGGELDNE